LFDRIKTELDGQKAPWMLAALTLSSHEPFQIPGRKTRGDETSMFRNSIRYTDSCLGVFWEQAKKSSWFNNTLVIITADHGHGIGLETGHMFHPELFRIPMLVAGGALRSELRGKYDTGSVSQTHIAPNILHQLGMTVPPEMKYSTWWDNTPDIAAYSFQDGIGLVKNRNVVVYENRPWRRTLLHSSTPEADTVDLYSGALQQFWINLYQKL
jgi:arylsulfatase A-like enzyme